MDFDKRAELRKCSIRELVEYRERLESVVEDYDLVIAEKLKEMRKLNLRPVSTSDNRGHNIEVMFCLSSHDLVQVRMGEYRIVFCPKCLAYQGDVEPKLVLCCVECKKPLSVMPFHKEGESVFSSYCMSCCFTPSMQDTYFGHRSCI